MASAQRALAPPLEWRAVSSDLRSHVPSVRGTRRAVLILLLLSAVTFFFGLGRQAITDSDEGFYAEAAREMVESGDWLTPHFNYEQRWQKPALYYWLAASTYLITGPTEFAARWWSAPTVADSPSGTATRGCPTTVSSACRRSGYSRSWRAGAGLI